MKTPIFLTEYTVQWLLENYENTTAPEEKATYQITEAIQNARPNSAPVYTITEGADTLRDKIEAGAEAGATSFTLYDVQRNHSFFFTLCEYTQGGAVVSSYYRETDADGVFLDSEELEVYRIARHYARPNLKEYEWSNTGTTIFFNGDIDTVWAESEEQAEAIAKEHFARNFKEATEASGYSWGYTFDNLTVSEVTK